MTSSLFRAMETNRNTGSKRILSLSKT